MRYLDQRVEIYTSFDAHFFTHKHQVFGANVTCCTTMPSEGATTQSRARAVIFGDTHLEGSVDVRQPRSTRIVQMKPQSEIGPPFSNSSDSSLHHQGIGPPNGVGQIYALQLDICLGSQVKHLTDHPHNLWNGHVALVVAAKSGHDVPPLDRNFMLCV
ncbi:hypothetical protein D3C81_1350410 [compost metagenome]